MTQRSAGLARSASIVVALGLGLVGEARGHDAATGWSYPFSCCSFHDCYVVSPDELKSVDGGWLILATGEFRREGSVSFSPDGQFHRCSVGGDRTKRTICLFVPPQSS